MEVENMDVDESSSSIDPNALLPYTPSPPSRSNAQQLQPFAALPLPHHPAPAVAGHTLLPHLILASGSQAAFAPTVPDPQPSVAGPSTPFDRSQNAPSPSILDTHSRNHLARALKPMENLRDYALHAFVPPIPAGTHVGQYLNNRLLQLCQREVNRLVRPFDPAKDVRNDEGELVLHMRPSGGERRLVEVIRIDDSLILQAASDWNVGALSPIPSNVDLHQLYRSRPDLFHPYWPERDPSITPSSPAPSEVTDFDLEFDSEPEPRHQLSQSTGIQYARSMVAENGDPVTPEEYDPAVRIWDHHPNADPGLSRGPPPSLRKNLIAFTLPASGYTIDKLSRPSAPPRRAVVKVEADSSTGWAPPNTLPSNDNDSGDDTDSESGSPSPKTPMRSLGTSGPSGLGSFDDLRDGLSAALLTASQLLPYTATKEQSIACILHQTLLVTASSLLHVSATTDQLNGWQWLDRDDAETVAQRTGRSVQGAFGVEGWEAFVWGRKPTTTKGIEPVKVQQGWMAGIPRPEHKTGKLGMLFVTLPPWALTLKTFCDFSQMQEFSDGARGEHDFLNFEALWAALYDSCQAMGVHYFVVSSYDHVALGCFTADWQSAYISQPYSTTPPLPTDPRNPISPTTMPPLDGSATSGPRKPNALQLLSYWMLSSVGTFPGVWSIPSEAGPVGPLGLSSKRGAFELRETLWPFKLDGEFVHPEVAAAVAQLGEDESTYLAARRAQMSQALDLGDYVQFKKGRSYLQPLSPQNSFEDDEVEEGYNPGSQHGDSVIVDLAAEDDHADLLNAGPSASMTTAHSKKQTSSTPEWKPEYICPETGFRCVSHPVTGVVHYEVGGHRYQVPSEYGSDESEVESGIMVEESSSDESCLKTPVDYMPPTLRRGRRKTRGRGSTVHFAEDCDMDDGEVLVTPRRRSTRSMSKTPILTPAPTPLRRTNRTVTAPERYTPGPAPPRAKSGAPSVAPVAGKKRNRNEIEAEGDLEDTDARATPKAIKRLKRQAQAAIGLGHPSSSPMANRRTPRRSMSIRPS